MTEKHLLITGRSASGKTELLIAFANMHLKTTLFWSDEHTEEELKKQKGLNEFVKVIDSSNFTYNLISEYTSLCIDYLELQSVKTLQEIIHVIKQNDIQVIVTSQVRRGNNEVIERIENLINRRRMYNPKN